MQGQLKLIDFGIAKAIQGDTTSINRESQVRPMYGEDVLMYDVNEAQPSACMHDCTYGSTRTITNGSVLHANVYGLPHVPTTSHFTHE